MLLVLSLLRQKWNMKRKNVHSWKVNRNLRDLGWNFISPNVFCFEDEQSVSMQEGGGGCEGADCRRYEEVVVVRLQAEEGMRRRRLWGCRLEKAWGGSGCEGAGRRRHEEAAAVRVQAGGHLTKIEGSLSSLLSFLKKGQYLHSIHYPRSRSIS